MIARILMFRRQLVALWHAFFHPATPFHLKVITVLTAAYVLSPIDLIPDLIPILGWLDDLIIVPLVVSWIISQLPRNLQPEDETRQNSTRSSSSRPQNTRPTKTIDGTARRM